MEFLLLFFDGSVKGGVGQRGGRNIFRSGHTHLCNDRGVPLLYFMHSSILKILKKKSNYRN